MENTPLLLWWEIAFFLFSFENFTADLARPGSKSKLGFCTLLQHWLHIGISHCFWNQPEKMSLCREQGAMCQKSKRSRERPLVLPSLPRLPSLAPPRWRRSSPGPTASQLLVAHWAPWGCREGQALFLCSVLWAQLHPKLLCWSCACLRWWQDSVLCLHGQDFHVRSLCELPAVSHVSGCQLTVPFTFAWCYTDLESAAPKL